MDLIESIAQSIAAMEGYFKPNTIAQRNNNPGNLRSWGSTPTEGGYASFATIEEGWAALKKQIQLNIGRGLSLEEFFGGKPGVYPGYAPSTDKNDPAGYARFVADRTGIASDQPISAFLTGGGASSPAASYGALWPALAVDGEGSGSPLLYAAIALAAAAAIWFFID